MKNINEEGRKEGREGGKEGGRESRLPQLDVHPSISGTSGLVRFEARGDLLAEEGGGHLLDHAVGLGREGREGGRAGRM